jgi:hypothetical protein
MAAAIRASSAFEEFKSEENISVNLFGFLDFFSASLPQLRQILASTGDK